MQRTSIPMQKTSFPGSAWEWDAREALPRVSEAREAEPGLLNSWA